MHYAGMRAATFRMVDGQGAFSAAAGISSGFLGMPIGGATLLILVIAIGASSLERLPLSVARREARIALHLEIADLLREGETMDALQAVAALTGEHFGVVRTGYGLLDAYRDEFDYEICWTDGTVAPLLGCFPAEAFGAKIVAELAADRIVAIEDILADPLSDESLTRQTARQVDTRGILVVPFVAKGRLRSIVYLNNRAPRVWTRDDIDFMTEIAERTRLVSERAAIEQQLRDLNATLEARVEARSKELRQMQDTLLQSQKMEAVGQLVAGLAHDFNNVLGAMVGAFGLILRRVDQPDRIRHFAEAGLLAGERGAKLTGQLLAFSRSQGIELRPLLVNRVIGAIEDLVYRTVGPMMRVTFDLSPSPEPVLADPTQVEMMILNLAINGRDAMPEGGTLTIATTRRTIRGEQDMVDGDCVELAVIDNGTGMDEQTLRRAAEPFFTTKPVGKGTGLGHAQIYASARQAGGPMRIESRPGEGTTVRVLLAVTDRQPDAEAALPMPPEPGAGASLRVLLVDDDHDMRAIMTRRSQSDFQAAFFNTIP